MRRAITLAAILASSLLSACGGVVEEPQAEEPFSGEHRAMGCIAVLDRNYDECCCGEGDYFASTRWCSDRETGWNYPAYCHNTAAE